MDKISDEEFDNYLVDQERVDLRFSALLLMGINAVFIVIDFFRVHNFLSVLLFRLVFISIFGSMLFVPFSRIKGWKRRSILFAAHIVTLIFIFYMDYASDVPIAFLSNTVIAYAFCTFTITALRFRYALILNLVSLTLFILHLTAYCKTPFHPTQVPALVSTFILSTVIGYLLERSKRLNFLQKQKITQYSHELEKANKQKTIILSILSHDLASPLNSLAGLIQARNHNLISTEEWDLFMGKLTVMLGSTNILLQNLVRWSKTQLDGFTPSYRVVQISKLIEESIESLDQAAQSKKVQVIRSFDENISIRTDPDMLELILRNIISNAIKFSFQDSSIEISAKKLPSCIEVMVMDRGIGMTEEQRSKLFYDLSKSQPGTLNEKGTGIGLLLTQSFISILKGKIEAESAPGKGTMMRITLPD